MTSNPRQYRLYRAQILNGTLVIQNDSSVWQLVDTAEHPASFAAVHGPDIIELSDSNVDYGKTFAYRVTSVDNQGNESAAQARPHIHLRRHLGHADLTGSIVIGQSPLPTSSSVQWVYILDPLAAPDGAGTAGVFSSAWKLYDTASEADLQALEKFYSIKVIDPSLGASPEIAAIAHGGDGLRHLQQPIAAPLHEDGKIVDFFSFPDETSSGGDSWRNWKSNYGQNLPSSWYSGARLGIPYKAQIRITRTIDIVCDQSEATSQDALRLRVGHSTIDLEFGEDSGQISLGSNDTEMADNLKTALDNHPIASDLVETTKPAANTVRIGLKDPTTVVFWAVKGRILNSGFTEAHFFKALVTVDNNQILDGDELTVTLSGVSRTYTAKDEPSSATDFAIMSFGWQTAERLLMTINADHPETPSLSRSMDIMSIEAIQHNSADAVTSPDSFSPFHIEQIPSMPVEGLNITHNEIYPQAGDTISLFEQVQLTFDASQWGAGTGKVQLLDGTGSQESLISQLHAIAAAINTAITPALPVRAYVDPLKAVCIVESDGLYAEDPDLQTDSTALTIVPIQARSTKSPDDAGDIDTDLTPFGEGSGQGFAHAFEDEGHGHIHLIVDWRDDPVQRGTNFERGVILVNGRFFKSYTPGEARHTHGVVQYLITTDKTNNRIIPADGKTPTVIEVRKYHPLGHFSRDRVVKTCPKRTLLTRRDGLRLLAGSETWAIFNPWDERLRFMIQPKDGWYQEMSKGFMPIFASWEAYLLTEEDNPSLRPDYYFQNALHSDLKGTKPLLTLELPADSPDPLTNDGSIQPESPVVIGDFVSRSWHLTSLGIEQVRSALLYLRVVLHDGWGLDDNGIFHGNNTHPGNRSLWSVPFRSPALDKYNWTVRATGTEYYLEESSDSAEPTMFEEDRIRERLSPPRLHSNRAFEAHRSFQLLTRAWEVTSQATIRGWRRTQNDESRTLRVVLGTSRVRPYDSVSSMGDISELEQLASGWAVSQRVPSRQTLAVKVESIDIRDSGDNPLLRDFELAEETDRHEVATYIPRNIQSSIYRPFSEQHQLSNSHIVNLGESPTASGLKTVLEPGNYTVLYQAGHIDNPGKIQLMLNIQTPTGRRMTAWDLVFPSIKHLNTYLSQKGAPFFHLHVDQEGEYIFFSTGNSQTTSSNQIFSIQSRPRQRQLRNYERPEIPYFANDFKSWDDSNDIQGEPSGAFGGWDSGEDTRFHACWHSADYADVIPAGDYPLSPDAADMEQVGPELVVVSHALRSDRGYRIIPDMSSSRRRQLDIVRTEVHSDFGVELPALIPIYPMNFGRKTSGWGLNIPNEHISERTFDDVLDTRISGGSPITGFRILRPAEVWSPRLNLDAMRFNTIAIGSDAPDLELLWVMEDGERVPISLVPSGNFVKVSNQILPAQPAERLIVRFTQMSEQQDSMISVLPRRLYGVWMLDSVVEWIVQVLRDGSPWDGATGSTSPINIDASTGSLTRQLPWTLIAEDWEPGQYDIIVHGQVSAGGPAQTSGNSSKIEAELTLGKKAFIRVEVI